MNGADLPNVRDRLGRLWGFGRPLYRNELGRALRLKGADVGATVRNWEDHAAREVSGPVTAAIDTWLAGAPPPDPLHVIRKRGR